MGYSCPEDEPRTSADDLPLRGFSGCARGRFPARLVQQSRKSSQVDVPKPRESDTVPKRQLPLSDIPIEYLPAATKSRHVVELSSAP